MHKPLIKICGIGNPQIAELTGHAGAQFIGLVFHPTSKRFVPLEHAKVIVDAIKKTNAKPVAVFTEHSAAEMLAICQATDIHIVQLHGKISKAEHVLLPNDYQRLYVRPVTLTGEIVKDTEDGLRYCDPERDFLLFDYMTPGIGQPFNWHQFNSDTPFRWFLAGGLTPQNVDIAIKQLHPAGVDVSSGIENQAGEKDITLIKQFIARVNGALE